ncbi:hypothetical protein N2488_01770 [SAR92 clade bacterium H231]|nr:hypothetical protein [SAR92 clade bacterium H231]
MNSPYVISTVIPLAAITISIISLYSAHKTSKKMIAFEEKHAKVSEIKIQTHEAEEKQKQKANLHMELHSERGSGKFIIENKGPASAHQIHFSLTDNNCHDPLVHGDYENKIPFPRLNKGESYFLLTSFPMGSSQSIHEVLLRWTNADKTEESQIYSLAR